MHMTKIPLKKSPLSLMILSIVSGHLYAETAVEPDNVQQLNTIVISAEQNANPQQQYQKELAQVSGGTNFIGEQQLEQQRLATTADVFRLQPGIYAQSAGNEGAKISIRGSGINRTSGAHASGTHVLIDDIPFTGPGGTAYELLEPWWIDHVGVYRGANGFKQGGLALGGTINYKSKTGADQDGSELKYEMGSHGYQKYQFSTGRKLDQMDYYLALTGTQFDGIQDHAEGDGKGLAFNLGYQISPDIETRFYARYRESKHLTPGRITQEQLKNDPEAANSFNLAVDAKRIQPGSTWLANTTTWNLQDDAKLTGSLAYHHYPLDLRESSYRTNVDYEDITARFQYEKPYQFLGLEHQGRIALRSTTHRPDSGVTETIRRDTTIDGTLYPADTVTRRYTYRGSDNVLQFDQETALNDQFKLDLGLAAVYTHRESEVTYPVASPEVSRYEWNFVPRLGLTYQPNESVQWFANLSRSIEPAHPWAMAWSSPYYFDSGVASGRVRAPIYLDTQTANSFELGGRGQSGFGDWALSYYYSKVKNELLTSEMIKTYEDGSNRPSEPIAVESNATPTIHQGVELSLDTPLHESQYGELRLQQAYTLSDFQYKNDPLFGKNQLPGIPKHLYQAQLSYALNNGLYIGLNTEYASKMAHDYANSRFSDDYQIWGIDVGYAPEHQSWKTWINFKNITDEKYAAVVIPGLNDKGADVARSSPGEGFSTYAGVSFKF
ncbi:TonB-dependent receptor [Acinetobacter lwoffii]|uniref:TonB-dependent receptor family protein n=1 Tax=Acinetobacter lwoffii TaxID=28090 RepID=UPI0011DCCC4E|nr:TonB-dependent receptor [Acinetobacter lwoffii]MDP1317190.1 TonB-dependent receptor [Acinetobacter lwoffii]MRA03470.1 TonB-dependent receptor [Acinetobacter lwoffii]